MNSYTFHITLYDLFFFGMICIGLAFAALLAFGKNINRSANRLLALALLTMILWMMRILAMDIGLQTHLPMQFLLALGPLVYFYVLKLTRPEHRFRRTNLLHFIPVLLEQVILLNAVLQLLIFISVITYLQLSFRLIQNFYRRLQPVLMDRSLLEFRWLRRLLAATALLWVLWIVYAAVDYFGYGSRLGVHGYCPFYIFFAVILIWTAMTAFLRPQAGAIVRQAPAPKPSAGAELRQKGAWLRNVMKTNLYYQDPELSLGALAEKLGLTTHELSRILNTVLKKSFSDFINEYRVAEVIRNMQDHAYDHLTLMGIAYDSGFNSKSAFHRIFKEKTGKSPAGYKAELKKELPAYNLGQNPRFVTIISFPETAPKWYQEKLNRNVMFRNYLKIAWRNLFRNQVSSIINISALTIGMAAAMIIGLWIWDELSFNRYHENYDRIAQVMQTQTFNNTVTTAASVPLPLEEELKKTYGNNFKHVVLFSWTNKHVFNVNEKVLSFPGSFIAPDGPEMFSLHMLKGNIGALEDPASILISQSIATAMFGDADPMDKLIRLDNSASFKIAGVYADLPLNTTLHDLAFLAPWHYYYQTVWANNPTKTWTDDSFRIYVEIADRADMNVVSAKIKNIKLDKISHEAARSKPAIFLQPMSKWHLYSEFKDGINTGGAIRYVWLLGIIGAFVLLLACINFMNLSTARSEKRAREVGIRKAVGSLRSQLIMQFFCESLLLATLAFVFSIIVAWLALPAFNSLTGKEMTVLWGQPLFWMSCISVTLFTGIVAGLYPALYLSSFNPIRVLKGTFKAGRFAAVPRQVLVIIQFSVSIVLIIGTIVVFRQIQFAKDRPVGYSRNGLVCIETVTDALTPQFKAMRDDLLKSGVVAEAAQSSSPTTDVYNNRNDITWNGKNPSVTTDFANVRVTSGYGKTVGWQFADGRDFSEQSVSDSTAVVLNEAAVKYMGLKHPVGQIIKMGGTALTVIGVVKDMVMQSPYEPVKQTIFYLSRNGFSFLNFKINPNLNAHNAIDKVAAIYKTYAPQIPFSYRFADDDYDKKFSAETRIGSLARCFAILAILISCMGLFGMVSFVAEQRRKEIGVRKVLGASVFGIWQTLSVDFLRLVAISLLVATPIAYYYLHNWLQQYTYRAALAWWIFGAAAAGTLFITLLTVSYQCIRAALANPVKSLRSE